MALIHGACCSLSVGPTGSWKLTESMLLPVCCMHSHAGTALVLEAKTVLAWLTCKPGSLRLLLVTMAHVTSSLQSAG